MFNSKESFTSLIRFLVESGVVFFSDKEKETIDENGEILKGLWNRGYAGEENPDAPEKGVMFILLQGGLSSDETKKPNPVQPEEAVESGYDEKAKEF